MSDRTIALFGATGRTGQQVLDSALRSGYAVRALIRRPDAFQPPDGVTVVAGDVLDPAAVDIAIEGADAVVSVFGQVKGSPATVQTDGTRNIVAAMRRHDVSRIVSLSGGALPAPQDRPRLPDKLFGLLLRTFSSQVLDDAIGHLHVLQESGLDWTVVRAPRLSEGKPTGSRRVGWAGVNTGLSIDRADLAAFIVSQITDLSYLRQLPFVSK